MKKTFTTITLAIILTLGTTFANADGIIIRTRDAVVGSGQPCTKVGILTSELIGIIIRTRTGIIFEVDVTTTKDCSI